MSSILAGGANFYAENLDLIKVFGFLFFMSRFKNAQIPISQLIDLIKKITHYLIPCEVFTLLIKISKKIDFLLRENALLLIAQKFVL